MAGYHVGASQTQSFMWQSMSLGQAFHFRMHCRPRTTCKFHIGENEIHIVQCYIYLGGICDEYLNFKTM